MKRLITLILTALMGLNSAACAQNKQNSKQEKENTMTDKKILVAYFSRADENYAVGNITKGNTEKIAEVIAAETGAETFHIETVTPYPKAYNPCIEQAKKELNAKARPEIKGDVRVEDYDVIFIGYPNWWGEPPMALYTFIEKHNWTGKTIVPFITHEGSGFGGTDRRVASACKGAVALKGLAVRGAVAQEGAESTVKAWLETIKSSIK